MTRSRLRVLLACLATLAIVVPLAWMWQASRMPSTYSVMDMGYVDYGGGPSTSMAGHGDHGGGAAVGGSPVSVADLTADPDAPADVTVDLVAEKGRFTLRLGREVDGYTLNGTSPGPLIEADQGDLVEVRVRNESVPDGITLHWHGVDVPNAVDGVAGVTQDAVGIGEEHTYRFVAEDAGTYWYHSHQVSHAQVIGGLLGPGADPPGAARPGAPSTWSRSPTSTAACARSTARRATSPPSPSPASGSGCASSTPTTARSSCGPVQPYARPRGRRRRRQRAHPRGRARR